MKVKRDECEAQKLARRPQIRAVDYVLQSLFSMEEIKTFLSIILDQPTGRAEVNSNGADNSKSDDLTDSIGVNGDAEN